VPSSAAVNESVRLAEKNGKRQLKGFVNAILRKVSQNLGKIKYPDAGEDLIEYLHIMYSYPRWLCEKYVTDYGRAQAEAMLEYEGDNALTCMRLNKFKRSLPPEGSEPGRYLDDAFYIRGAYDIERMPLLKKGEITVQGEASMICVRASGIKKDDNVLDVCAAPGGKSAYAAWFARGGSVTSLDLHAHRVELIKNTAERMGIPNIAARQADAAVFMEEYEGRFDVVLADVPCSALGLLYRKPDIKLFKNAEDITSLAEVQRSILSVCARYVKSGGVLLYSTCTIDREENERNVEWFLEKEKGFRLDDLKNYIPEALMHRAGGGMLQLFPHIDKIDGFFIARMVKG